MSVSVVLQLETADRPERPCPSEFVGTALVAADVRTEYVGWDGEETLTVTSELDPCTGRAVSDWPVDAEAAAEAVVVPVASADLEFNEGPFTPFDVPLDGGETTTRC